MYIQKNKGITKQSFNQIKRGFCFAKANMKLKNDLTIGAIAEKQNSERISHMSPQLIYNTTSAHVLQELFLLIGNKPAV